MNGIRNSFESRDVSYGSVATSSIGPCRLFHALSAVSSRIIIKNISIVNHLLRLRKKDREDRSNSLLNREEEENESLRSFNYQGSFIRVFLSDFNVALNPFGITATASRRIVATRRTHEEWRRACLGPRYTAN